MDVQLSMVGSSGSCPSSSSSSSSSGGGGCSLLLAVGLSDNSVQAFTIQLCMPPSSTDSTTGSSGRGNGSSAARVQPVVHSECSDRCLLYSMALLPQQHGLQEPEKGHQLQKKETSSSSGSGGGGRYSYLVAAGTIFLDVVVWAAPAAAAAAAVLDGTQAAAAPQMALVLFRLKGHEGSIHRCCSS
jgi:hypothetical protein